MARLRQGGVVAIAADVPVASGGELIFFGQRSQLPVGHARLALRTGAQMLVGVSHRTGEGSYRAALALAPQPESTGGQKQDSVRWPGLASHAGGTYPSMTRGVDDADSGLERLGKRA